MHYLLSLLSDHMKNRSCHLQPHFSKSSVTDNVVIGLEFACQIHFLLGGEVPKYINLFPIAPNGCYHLLFES